MDNKQKHISIGICLGATTFSLVKAEVKDGSIKIIEHIREEHEGDPKGLFKKHLEHIDTKDAYLGVTGRKFRKILNFKSIIEPLAVEYAYKYTNTANTEYDAIVSAGGETFIVYEMDKKGKINRISSGNKCASGTGEFFMQQIGRMHITPEEATELSKQSDNPHHLSGRCSVFCKSDCTHALNKGEPIADVAAGLSRMISQKIDELLVKVNAKKVMIVGGTTLNPVIIDFLREDYDVTVPEESAYFEALGAALWAYEEKQDQIPEKENFFKPQKPSFEFLRPLKEFEGHVDFKQMPYDEPVKGDECIIGLDVGSTTTKAVLFRRSDSKILKSVYLRTGGNPIKASRDCYRSLLKQLKGTEVNITGLGVTGSGRYISGLHADTDGIINEIIAHARASAFFDGDVDTIFEIGGQDAKYTYLTNSVASDYAMNEACSAGTGSFLEESALEQLGVKLEDIAGIALSAGNPPNFSDQCAAFISSDINTAFQEGVSKDDIIAGLVYSICINYINRVKGARQVGKKIFMQGGVCYNKAVPVAMAALLGKDIIVPPEPGLMGAYGVALEVKNLLEIGLLEKKSFNLAELADREVQYGKNFICQGKAEKCDRRCEVNMIHIGDKKFPFGGACNKYYNLQHKIKVDIQKLNHVEKRTELLYKAYNEKKDTFEADKPVIGLNASFQMNTLLPMFFTFFNELGCKVVVSDTVYEEAMDKGMTSFCLSGYISLGLFQDLLNKGCDYVFMPQIMEMNVSEQDSYRKEYQTTCMFIQGEPFYQQATFLQDKKKPVILSPAFNFMKGFDAQEEVFLKIARDLGFDDAGIKEAHRKAFEAQMDFFGAMKEEGKRILQELKDNPDRTAVVLFGRPYNAFDDKANKGVPFKFASRGIEIIPYDFLMYELEPNYKDTYWEMGQRIIKGARIVERNPQLFGCYLTNFLCALDSMMIPHFRDLMGIKPSLTIEVDTHTADAGVNTRIEAFMDVVKNFLKVHDTIEQNDHDFKQAVCEIDSAGRAWYVDSKGERFSIKDKRVKVVIPCMGDLFNTAGAAALRAQGWNAEGLEECDREALDLGRSVVTGKECLPIINIIGEILKYLRYRENHDEKLAVFLVSAGGCCRVGQYEILAKTVIDKLKLKDVAIITLSNDNGYAGLGVKFRLDAAKLFYASDVMDDVRSAIKALAADRKAGMELFYQEWDKICATIDGRSKLSFYNQLKKTARRFNEEIKLTKPISDAKYIGVVGEIFVRRDHFSLMSIPEMLAEEGFVMLDAYVMEWNRYVDFLKKIKMFESQVNFVGKVEEMLSAWIQDYHEKKIKRIFTTSGLYEYELIDIEKYMKHSEHFFPYTLTGEPGLSSGAGLYHLVDKYCGLINIGPFGCMNTRMTEAVATNEFTLEGKERAAKQAGLPSDYSQFKENIDVLPVLHVESDGNPFSQILEARFETFLLQADRLYKEMKKIK